MKKSFKYKVVGKIIVDDDDKNSDYWDWFKHNLKKPKFYGNTLAYKIIAGKMGYKFAKLGDYT